MTITTRELCSLVGITYRQADYWIRCGYLLCTNPEAGSGHARFHDVGELRVAHALRQVQAAGCHHAGDVAEAVRALPDDTTGSVLLDARGRHTEDLDAARWVVQVSDDLALA